MSFSVQQAVLANPAALQRAPPGQPLRLGARRDRSALPRDVRVSPVLVDGDRMPPEGDLRERLLSLAYCNAEPLATPDRSITAASLPMPINLRGR